MNIFKKRLALVIGSLTLFFGVVLMSFTVRPGGDSFTISLNKKILVEQFVHLDKNVKTISLGNASTGDRLAVKYSHCGQVGKDRTIALQDEQRNAVKQWRFADGAESRSSAMEIKVEEVVALQRMHRNTLRIVYTSRELPEGKVLAAIELPSQLRASAK